MGWVVRALIVDFFFMNKANKQGFKKIKCTLLSAIMMERDKFVR